MKWVFLNGETKAIEKYGITYNSRSHEILMLGYDNVGKKLSIQIAREHCGLEPNYESLERALVAKLHEPFVETYIKKAVSELESVGVTIDKPKNEVMKTGTVYVCMTGSPKLFGFKTK